jgi:cyclopropane-fatty-acyl-phospholipid synthase
VLAAALDHRLSTVGLTISREQHDLAQQRLAAAGLDHRAEIRLQDYREVPAAEDGTYDRIASGGMFEHVGQANIPLFFQRVARRLKPGGLLLLHTIGRVRPEPGNPWIEKHLFPGGYIPSLGETTEAAAAAGLKFLDLENLRPHYDHTLGHWIERFDARSADIRERMGEPFVRLWRLYLHGSQMAFRHGSLHLFQFLFARGQCEDWPLNREWMTALAPTGAGGR